MSDIGVGNTLIINTSMPERYVEARRRALREQAWLAILDEIILKPENKNKYVVIHFKDKEQQVSSSSKEYQVEFEISFAREQHIRFMSISDMDTKAVYQSAVNEMKFRIERQWHKFWNTERVKRG